MNSRILPVLIIVGCLVIIGAIAGYTLKKMPVSTAQPTITPSVNAPTASQQTGDSTLQMYHNQAHHFQISYSKDLGIQLYESQKDADKINSLSYLPICNPESSVVCLYIPQSTYPHTNFEAAILSVNVTGDKTEKDCLAFQNADFNVTDSSKKVTINGLQFTEADGGDAGAGHQHTILSFHTFTNNTCFAVNESVATTAFGNYPAGSIREFTKTDQENLFKKLHAITESFKLD
jgi:flagellar hook-associated protein FlgK